MLLPSSSEIGENGLTNVCSFNLGNILFHFILQYLNNLNSFTMGLQFHLTLFKRIVLFCVFFLLI